MRRAWLIPDLSLAAAFVSLVYCFLLFNGVQRLFRDSDSGWHIRTGEAILASGSLPRSDPYSFTRAGQPWYAWEWGSDVAMGLAHRLGGLRGVALLYALAIAAAVWLWFRLHWAVGGDFFIACVMAAPMLTTTNLHWLARPHVLSWVLLLAALWHAETRERSGRGPARDWFLIAAFGALWANVHASFLLAPAIALIYSAAHFIRPALWKLEAHEELAQARWFLGASGCALLGTLLNPYGYKLHLHVVRYLTDSELLARIGEFQSFNFHAAGAGQILAAVSLAGLGAVLALAQKKVAHFLLGAVLLAAALRSARGLPVAALALLPLANGAITAALRGARDVRPRVRRLLDGFLAYSGRLRLLDARLSGAALVPVVVLLAVAWLRLPAVGARTGFPPDEFPVAASGAVEKLPPGARLLAPDKYGGYLIYRFGGERKVYFDGRSDFYGAAFMENYIRLMQVRPGWRAQVDALGFTHALLPNDYALVAALEQIGWKPIYRDNVATLLAKPGSELIEILGVQQRIFAWTGRKHS